jgi:hypothetical protein
LESAGELCAGVEYQFKHELALVERINNSSFWWGGKTEALKELIERVQGAYNPSGEVDHPLHDQVDRFNNETLKELYKKIDELEKMNTTVISDPTDAKKPQGVTKEEREAAIKKLRKLIKDVEYIRGFVMDSEQYKREEEKPKNPRNKKEQVRQVPVDHAPISSILPKDGHGRPGTPQN